MALTHQTKFDGAPNDYPGFRKDRADPLIWTGYPDWKLTIAGRLYLFTRGQWRRYEQIAWGRVPVAEVQRQNRPAAFVLRPSYHKRFVRLLREIGDWDEAYADGNAVVFVRG